MIKTVTNDKAFLGKGWSFPPTFTKSPDGKVVIVAAEQDIVESLKVLLTTLPGERIMEPQFGCDLREMLFEPMDSTFVAYIEDIVATALVLHEPRIEVNRIHVETSNANEGRVDIEVDYTVRATNSRFNFVYPFYIKEGTGVSQ